MIPPLRTSKGAGAAVGMTYTNSETRLLLAADFTALELLG